MATRLPFSSEQYFDACKAVGFVGAKMFTYEAGTTTDKITWTAADELTSHLNPVQADANGIFPEVYGNDSFRIVIKNFAEDIIILDVDNITGSLIAGDFVNVAFTQTITGEKTFNLATDKSFSALTDITWAAPTGGIAYLDHDVNFHSTSNIAFIASDLTNNALIFSEKKDNGDYVGTIETASGNITLNETAAGASSVDMTVTDNIVLDSIAGIIETDGASAFTIPNVLDIQVDATLDPGASPATGAGYIITDSAALNANFGTITGVGDDDVVVYDGTDFIVRFDASTGIPCETYNNADDTKWLYDTVDWTRVSVIHSSVYFDGTVAAASMINKSYNVNSITDNGLGNYDVNLSSAIVVNDALLLVSGGRFNGGANVPVQGANVYMPNSTTVNIVTGSDSTTKSDWQDIFLTVSEHKTL